jgi:hypothetical protein
MPVTLNDKTLIPVSLLIQLIVLVGSLFVFYHKIDARITRLEAASGNAYTLTMAAEQALRTAIANKGLHVADPRNPGQYISTASTSVTHQD